MVEFPADEPERALRFWGRFARRSLERRSEGEGEGWQSRSAVPPVGLHPRGRGPGDSFSLPYFAVDDLPEALAEVAALGGSVVHPGESWAVCEDSEGSPFGLARFGPTISAGCATTGSGLRNGFRPRKVQTAEGSLRLKSRRCGRRSSRSSPSCSPGGTKLLRTEPLRAMVMARSCAACQCATSSRCAIRPGWGSCRSRPPSGSAPSSGSASSSSSAAISTTSSWRRCSSTRCSSPSVRKGPRRRMRPDGRHRYSFRLYALDSDPDLPPGAGKRELERALDGHTRAVAELIGTYER